MSDAPPQIDQLAGHQGNIVPLGGGKIKKLVKEREAAFYNSLEDRKLSPTIMKYIPTFYGIEVATNGKYIIIEDLTANYGKEANVMDMKMGTTSADPTDAPEKQAEMTKKDMKTTTTTLGLRVCGMKVHSPEKGGEVFKVGKPWGKAVKDATEMKSAITKFFSRNGELRKDVMVELLPALREIQTWFKNESSMYIISSSLLFVWDPTSTEPKVTAKIIDFAHVVDINDPNKRDDNWIAGIDNLIAYFEELSK